MMRLISKRSVLLALLDALAVTAAFGGGFFIRTGGFYGFQDIKFLNFYGFYLLILITLFYVFDLYYPFKYFKKAATIIDIIFSVVIGMLIAAAASYAKRSFMLPRLIFVYTGLLLIPLIYLNRLFYDFLFASHFFDQRVLVLGTGPLASQIVDVIKKTPHSGMELIGVVSENRDISKKTIQEIPVVGNVSDIVSLIDWYNIRLVVLALDPKQAVSEAGIMSQLFENRVTITSSIHLFERLTGDVPYELFGSHYLLGLMSQIKTRPYLKLKRLMDIGTGVILLGLLSPVLLFAMLILMFQGPQRIFFVQERIGRNGKTFQLIKLRSMRTGKSGKPVVTRLGKWIRKYRIDEIPQLINVIKGNMSLIGPRPEIPYFVNKCRKRIPFYDAVYAVNPGLTGWAQVSFRYTRTMKDYDQKFRYNLYYLKNMSLALDVLILIKTIRIILLGKGQ